MNDHGCLEIEFETDTAARHKLWDARHNLAYAFIHGYKGKKLMTTDVCVSITDLADAVLFARAELEKVRLARWCGWSCRRWKLPCLSND